MSDAPRPTDDRALPGTRCPARPPRSVSRAASTSRRKSSSAAEVGVDRGVPALVRPDRPRHARVRRTGGFRVVRALAERPADRVDRRQVEHVEAHPDHVVEPGDDVVERTVAPRIGRGRARKELVPGGEACARRIDDDRQNRLESRCVTAVGMPPGGRDRGLVRGETLRLAVGIGGSQGSGPFAQPRRVVWSARRVGTRRRRVGQVGADAQIDRHVLAGVDALPQIADPRCEVIDPGFDRVLVAPDRLHNEVGPPEVVVGTAHLDLGPGILALVAVEEPRFDDVMSIGKRVREHVNGLADNALDREAARVHPRAHVLDDGTPAAEIVGRKKVHEEGGVGGVVRHSRRAGAAGRAGQRGCDVRPPQAGGHRWSPGMVPPHGSQWAQGLHNRQGLTLCHSGDGVKRHPSRGRVSAARRRAGRARTRGESAASAPGQATATRSPVRRAPGRARWARG